MLLSVVTSRIVQEVNNMNQFMKLQVFSLSLLNCYDDWHRI
jgi:hypothetical protein